MTEITFRSDMQVDYVQHMGSDEMVARAARVSTGNDLIENDKIKGLIRYLVRENHCYDPETEILTEDRGWVAFPDVHMQDRVLTRTLEGSIQWDHPTEIINEHYEGTMVRLTGRNLDALVTPNHRMLAEHRTKKGWQPVGIHPASEFQNRAYRILRGGGERSGTTVPRSRAWLLGFIIADAHVSRTSITFHLRKGRKIRRLVTETQGALRENAHDTYSVPLGFDPELTRLARETYTAEGNRSIPREVISTWSGESIRDLLEGYLEGDGHRDSKGSVTASTVSPVLAEQLQVLAALSGGAATVNGPFDYGESNLSSGFSLTAKPVYSVVFASDRHMKVRVGWTLTQRAIQVTQEEYIGSVHCVTVPSGIVYVRRRGQTMWSGNSSTLEHCTLTVRVEAPIFVAREWMRHRTMSYNEISGRYAELAPVFYIPDENRPLVNAGSGAHPLIEFSTDDDLPLYAEGQHLLSYKLAWRTYSNMREQGVANEVARNVLPVGTYTQFYATANLNNWFKFLHLRDGNEGHPQYEIVEAANKVAGILEELYPVTYGVWAELNGRG